MMLIETLLTALILTILIELAVLLFLRERRRKVLWASVAVNVMTNVPLNLFLLYVQTGLLTIAVGELLVVVIEAAWYYLFVRDWVQAAGYSLLCNAISFLSGILLVTLFI
jgi:hypothetical protein